MERLFGATFWATFWGYFFVLFGATFLGATFFSFFLKVLEAFFVGGGGGGEMGLFRQSLGSFFSPPPPPPRGKNGAFLGKVLETFFPSPPWSRTPHAILLILCTMNCQSQIIPYTKEGKIFNTHFIQHNKEKEVVFMSLNKR